VKLLETGIAFGDNDNARNLRWEAGFAVEAGLSFTQALASVTSNIADIYNITSDGTGRILINSRANFLAFDDNPFSLQSRIQLNVIGSQVVCKPKQWQPNLN